MLAATNVLSRQKHVVVATKIMLVATPANGRVLPFKGSHTREKRRSRTSCGWTRPSVLNVLAHNAPETDVLKLKQGKG